MHFLFINFEMYDNIIIIILWHCDNCVGFSFGGMLACYVAANLWRKSFISGDVLEKNVLCITFGQPLITIPYVEEAIKDFPALESTIHCVYDKEDFFTRVFHYFAIGCQHYFSSSQAVKALSQATSETLLTTNIMVCIKLYTQMYMVVLYYLPFFNNVQDFNSAFAHKFLHCLASIQKVS